MQDRQEERGQADRELFERVVRHVGEFVEADVSYLTPDSHLASSIEGMSSLKMIEMLLYMEDCFGLDFDEGVVDKFEKVQDMVDYIRELQEIRK
ncbi:hypothetical protein KGA66_17380 [Actinocrinis puniceicyclus]|uniref:Carrier domain-containing protein n=1 Tax=Actinocrinis puniceicyclus TaxID=977794 RepID=A0A8J7WP15_9ACTN|nr:phosphopantetheine-binding protein [Actinocrinis puniceicyclus]MBS2964833.1 hypothetical protein [Actinocrinis puniceicyclus]